MATRKVYILLTNTSTWLSKAVKGYTKAPYSHVSLSMDEGLTEIYSFGRKRPHNPLYAGFVQEDVFSGTYRRFPNTTCAVYELEVTAIEYAKIQERLTLFKEDAERYNFNMYGLLGVMLNRPITPQYSYFCSQFVSEVVGASGVVMQERLASLTTPDDFRSSLQLTLLYEGLLYEYPPVAMAMESEHYPKPCFSIREDVVTPLNKVIRRKVYGHPEYSLHKEMTLVAKHYVHEVKDSFSRL